MRAYELAIVGAAHVAGLLATVLVMSALDVGEPFYALVVAAILGSEAGALLYHRRQPEAAPARVKLTVGAVLAILCAAESLIAQAAWDWIVHPDVVIPLSSVGTFFFPYAFFEPMRKALAKAREQQERKDP
ncbi:MAG: hypothetical protein FJ291_26125 [Planctomycetes bacterium]|nr:hypothetical protein [Planctomycetota bacterium]